MKDLWALLIPRMPVAASVNYIRRMNPDATLRSFIPSDTRVDTMLSTVKVPAGNKLYVNEKGELELGNASVNYPPDYCFIWLSTNLSRR